MDLEDVKSIDSTQTNLISSGKGGLQTSDDHEDDTCPICLSHFEVKEVCVPSCCSHHFCLQCLLEWSTKQQTCPIDRETFSRISILDYPNAPVRGELDLDTGEYISNCDTEEDTVSVNSSTDPAISDIVCVVCKFGDRPDRLLLCDRCDTGFHLECLNPPLEHVPEGNWYCPDCSLAHFRPLRRSERLRNLQTNRSSPINRSRQGLRPTRRMNR